MAYILLSILTGIQAAILGLGLWIWKQVRTAERGDGREAPPEDDRMAADAQWPQAEGDQTNFEKAFQEGMSSIMNYDVNAARKAVKRDA